MPPDGPLEGCTAGCIVGCPVWRPNRSSCCFIIFVYICALLHQIITTVLLPTHIARLCITGQRETLINSGNEELSQSYYSSHDCTVYCTANIIAIYIQTVVLIYCCIIYASSLCNCAIYANGCFVITIVQYTRDCTVFIIAVYTYDCTTYTIVLYIHTIVLHILLYYIYIRLYYIYYCATTYDCTTYTIVLYIHTIVLHILL